ncbi:MAG: hypothetical protein M2R45_00975 [Verrucomicrobia subdivision 3 bacterium]|nr:hypothetical protein [Limisphaerales bacterium]MCS1414642.1 hypothetical protein [Limisphaerales bacterium]
MLMGLLSMSLQQAFTPWLSDSTDILQMLSRIVHQSATPLKSRCLYFPDGLCTIVDNLQKKRTVLRPDNLQRLLTQLEQDRIIRPAWL